MNFSSLKVVVIKSLNSKIAKIKKTIWLGFALNKCANLIENNPESLANLNILIA